MRAREYPEASGMSKAAMAKRGERQTGKGQGYLSQEQGEEWEQEKNLLGSRGKNNSFRVLEQPGRERRSLEVSTGSLVYTIGILQ